MAWKIVLMFAVMMGTAHSISTADIINKPQDSKPHSEPMVAVSCSGGLSPEQYTLQYSSLSKDSSPWQQDLTTTGCITDKLEILKHCQRLFPSKDITNIVESNKVKVNTVCRVNKNIKSKSNKVKCGKSLNVNTVVFRCLESPFQSDALLVPSPCIFDHIHNASTCWESGAWNLTAYKSCTQRGEDFSLKSYAVLLPCGVGLFTGVEFVCCPGNNKISNNNNNNNKKVKETEAYDEYDDEEEDDDEEDEDNDDDDYLDYFEKATSTSTTTTTTTTTPAPSSDPQVDVYFRSPYDNSFNEHANFKQAENRLENLHRLRMSKVMRDWEELEKKYQEMRKSDETIEDAEEFKRTVTLRFQKTIKNLEEEGQAEKRQLLAVHQQRVLTHINERKKEAMECYTQSLNEGQNANKIRKCLEKLMRILHKDRHHTLAHFKHLLKSNPKQSQVEQEYTLQRLTQISQTARQALKMLARYPSLNNQLRAPLEDYVLGLQGRDDPPSSLLTATHETEQLLLEKYEQQQQISHGNNKIEQNEEISTNHPSSTPIVATSTSSSTFSDLTTPTVTTTVASGDENNSDEALEDNVIDKHLKRNDFTHDQIISVRREVYHRESRPIYFTMAFAGIALLGAVFIGLVVLVKRRVIDHPRNHGFLEVNTGPSNIHAGSLLAPEEKHVANMQINGYENPTYKYFETTATTANT